MLMLHGTCVELGGAGVLLRGKSGSGKSDLALRLIDGGARLVADDQTIVELRGEILAASPPETIRGLLEVRGIGILRLPHASNIPLALVVDLVPPDSVERMPEPMRCDILGQSLPLIALPAFESSSSAKIRLALQSVLVPDMVKT